MVAIKNSKLSKRRTNIVVLCLNV